jgi:hypothetical protein
MFSVFSRAFAVIAALSMLTASLQLALAQPPRKLAQGVLTVIPPEPKNEETFEGPLQLPGISRLNWDPNFTAKSETLGEKGSRVVIRHNIWNLELAFKPLRMVYIDIPQPTGKMQRKLIWYVVYRVRNLGGHLLPMPEPQQENVADPQKKTYKPEVVDQVMDMVISQPTSSLRFFPHFVLESREVAKSYLDRIVPAAIPVIQLREMRGGKLYSSVEITKVAIPVTRPDAEGGVWGVATWEDVDPRIDFFSIYVQGLTNAFRVRGSPQEGFVHLHKTLQLNFWRPSDIYDEHEEEIRYGVPAVSDPTEQSSICAQYGITERVDYLWVYR